MVARLVACRASPHQLEVLAEWIRNHPRAHGEPASESDALRAAIDALEIMEHKRTIARIRRDRAKFVRQDRSASDAIPE